MHTDAGNATGPVREPAGAVTAAAELARAPEGWWDSPAQVLLAAGLAFFALILLPAVLNLALPPADHPPARVTPAAQDKKPFSDAADFRGERPARFWVARFVLHSLFLGGTAACAAIGVAAGLSRDFRRRLRLWRTAPRPRPAVGLLAAALTLLLLQSVSYGLGRLLLGADPAEAKKTLEGVATAMSIQGVSYILALGLMLAALRGGEGPAGTVGLWPFWETPGLSPSRDIRGDVRLGLVAFLLCFWMIVTLRLANQAALPLVGLPPDRNPVLNVINQEISTLGRGVALAVVCFGAVVVAAIAEELVFRGLVHNALRRHLALAPAAVAGALLFSFKHGIIGDLWPLFLFGLALTWLYERTGRLLAPIAFHAANNLVVLILVWLAR